MQQLWSKLHRRSLVNSSGRDKEALISHYRIPGFLPKLLHIAAEKKNLLHIAAEKEKPCRAGGATLLLIVKRSGEDCTASSEAGRISTLSIPSHRQRGAAGTINNAAEAAEIIKPMCRWKTN